MTVDASHLVWPPFETLYDQIERIKLDPAAVDVHRLQTELQKYIPWLRRGLHTFRPPSDSSRKAIEGETRLTFGADAGSGGALEVTPHLRSVALALSPALNLDEIQTVILVHRCLMDGQGTAPGDGLDSDLVLPGGYVHVHYATKIARVYEQERLFLLKSIESLLWLGEGAIENAMEQCDCLQTVKDALDQLLMDLNGDSSSSKNAKLESSSLEEVTFRCLRENLEQKVFLLPEAVEIDIQSEVQSLYAKHPTRLRDVTASAAMERNVLIIILAIIYYHPRKQCTPERFVELARTFNSGLFSEEAASGDQASILSCHLATLLLLQVLSLDVHKIVECVGQGKLLGPESFAFLSAPIRAKVDKELGSKEWSESILRIRANDEQASESFFQADAMPVHATVLLTWAALLTLGGDGGVGGAAQQYAALATQGNALAGLAALASTPGLRHVSSEWAATVVFSAMTTILIAYQLDVHTFLMDQGQHVVDALCGVYEGHPSLCDAFWDSGTEKGTDGGGMVVTLNHDAASRSVHRPVRMVLRSLESIFPALPILLLRLLTSLASSSRSALAVRQYFSSMFTITSSPPTLSSVHELPDPHIASDAQYDQGGGDYDYDYSVGTSVVLRSPMILPGTGGVLAIPPLFYSKEKEGLNVSCGSILQVDWPPPATTTTTTATQVIIQWRIDDKMPLGFGFWVLMSRTWQKLDLLSTTDLELSASLTEVETVMGFFSTLCRRDASAPLALITVGTAYDGAPCTMCSSRNYLQNAGALGTVDCLTLVSKTLVAISKVLSHHLFSRSQPRGAMIRGMAWRIVSHCCRIAAALIPVAGSRRVMVDTVQVFMGGDRGSQSNQPTLGSAMVQDLDTCLDCCTAVNSFVKLLTELVQFRGEKKEAQDDVLDVMLEWVIACLFPGIRNLLAPYTLKSRDVHTHKRLNGGGPTKLASVRWQIASSAISLLHSSILHYRYPSSPMASALSMRTGLSTWLFPLLPLNAHELEIIAQDGQRAEEVEAVEACCLSWLRLLPDLLRWLTSHPGAGPSPVSAGSACEAYCRPTTRRGKELTPATVLLSYISYRYFGVCEQTLVMKALYAVSEAVGHLVPDLPLGSLLPGQKAGHHILDALRGCAQSVSSNPSNLDGLFAASCQVLISAIQHHPSLTETIFATDQDASSLIWSLITASSDGDSDGKGLHQAISLTVVAAAAGSGSMAPRAKFISRVPSLLWCQKEDFWSVVTSIVKRASKRQQRIEEESQAEVMAEVAALQIVFRLGPRQVVEDTIIPLLPALLDRYSSPVVLNTLIESGVILVRSATALGFTLLETTTTDLGLISPSSLPSLFQLSSSSWLHLADGRHEEGANDECGCKDTVYRLAEAYLLCRQSTDADATAGQLDSALADIILTAMDVDGGVGGELEVLNARLDAVDALLTLPLSLTSHNGPGTQGKTRPLQRLLRCIEPSLERGSKGTGTTQLEDLWKCFQDREAAAWLTHTQLLAVKTLDDIVSSVYLSHGVSSDATPCKSLMKSQLLESRTKVLSVLLSTMQAASHQLLALKPGGEAKTPSTLQIGIDAHVALASHVARVTLLVCNYRKDKNGEIATETETFGQAVVACEATAIWLEGVLNANDRVVRQCNKRLADVTSILLTLALQFIEKCASAQQGGTSSRSTLPAKTLRRLFEAVSSFIAAFAGRSVVDETMALRESGVAALSLATSLIRNRPQIAKLDGQYVGTVFSRLHIDLHFAEVLRAAHNNRPDGVAASNFMTSSTKNIDVDISVDSGSGGKRDLEELEAWLLLATQTISSFPEEGPRAFGLEDIIEIVLSMGAQSGLGELEPRLWRAVLELVAAAVRASPYQSKGSYYPNDPYSSTSMDARSSLHAYGQQSYSTARNKLAVWAAIAWHDRLVQGCRGSTTFEWVNEGSYDKSEKVEDVVSLESLQETRLCLFLACEAARDIGTWRLSLPFAIPVLRSSTTKLFKDALALLSEIKEEASLEWRVLAYACVADALRFQLAVTPQVQATDSTSIQHAVPDLLNLQTLCIDRLVGPGQLLSLVQGPEVQSGGAGRTTDPNSMRVVQSMASILGASSRLLTLASVRSVPAAEEVMRQCVATIEAWESRK
jgi:hypothetical protein